MAENKKRIAVLVSGGGTNLQALIDAQTKQIIKHGKISLVISNNPEAYALMRANMAGIPTKVILKKDFESQTGFEDAIILVNEDSINVIVDSENLKSEEVAKIQNIIVNEFSIDISKVHISNNNQ